MMEPSHSKFRGIRKLHRRWHHRRYHPQYKMHCQCLLTIKFAFINYHRFPIIFLLVSPCMSGPALPLLACASPINPPCVIGTRLRYNLSYAALRFRWFKAQRNTALLRHRHDINAVHIIPHPPLLIEKQRGRLDLLVFKSFWPNACDFSMFKISNLLKGQSASSFRGFVEACNFCCPTMTSATE